VPVYFQAANSSSDANRWKEMFNQGKITFT
jgi:hypothetical protein